MPQIMPGQVSAETDEVTRYSTRVSTSTLVLSAVWP